MSTQFRLKHTLGKEKWSKERVLQNTNEAGVFSLKEKKKKRSYSKISPVLLLLPIDRATQTH